MEGLRNLSPESRDIMTLVGSLTPSFAFGPRAAETIAGGRGLRPGNILTGLANIGGQAQQRRGLEQVAGLEQAAEGGTSEQKAEMYSQATSPGFLKDIRYYPELMQRYRAATEAIKPQPQIPAHERLGITPEDVEILKGNIPEQGYSKFEEYVQPTPLAKPTQLSLPPQMRAKDYAKEVEASYSTPLEIQRQRLQAGPAKFSESLEKRKAEVATEAARGRVLGPEWAKVPREESESLIKEKEKKYNLDYLKRTLPSITDPKLKANIENAIASNSPSAIAAAIKLLTGEERMTDEPQQMGSIIDRVISGELDMDKAWAEASRYGINFTKFSQYMSAKLSAAGLKEERKFRRWLQEQNLEERKRAAEEREEAGKEKQKLQEKTATENAIDKATKRIDSQRKYLASMQQEMKLETRDPASLRAKNFWATYGSSIERATDMIAKEQESIWKLENPGQPNPSESQAMEIALNFLRSANKPRDVLDPEFISNLREKLGLSKRTLMAIIGRAIEQMRREVVP